MGSPLDTGLVNKKRLKVFMNKPAAQQESNIPVALDSQGAPIVKEPTGFNIMRQVETCDEGNSPEIQNLRRSLGRQGDQ